MTIFKNKIHLLKLILKSLKILVESKTNENIQYTRKFLKHIKRVIYESENDIGKTDQLENIYTLFEMYSSRKKADYDSDDLEEEIETEEDRERLRRCIEYVASNANKLIHAENLNPPDLNNNFEEARDSPPNSSDEEVENMFYEDLLKVLMSSTHKKPSPGPEVAIKNDWFENK